MSAQTNPFTPLFGRVPSFIAGREQITESLVEALGSDATSPELCSIISGIRGSGKTTLLRYMSSQAEQLGWIVASTTAESGMLQDLLIKAKESAAHIVDDQPRRKITQVGISSVGSISFEATSAKDSNWRSKITALLEDLEKYNTGILFVVDEINSSLNEMVHLATVFQLLIGEERKVALFMAGLPYQVSSLLLGKTTSFLRRAQQFNLGSIPDYSVKEAFSLTVKQAGKTIDDNALEYAVKAIGGFPYLLQLVGFRAWRASQGSQTITLAHVKQGAKIAQEELKEKIFASTIEELSAGDIEFLNAMNKQQDFTTRAEIAKRTGRDSSWVSRYKKRLLVAGVIEEPRQGKFTFSLPGFAEYLSEV